MGDKKIIAVVGSTGAQGGGLVRAIMNNPSGGFSARAITRDINSGKARELIKMGVEVVAADIDDEQGLEKALQGAYGAYFVTFYWEHLSPDKEMAEARNMARAAKTASVKHAIWSTLDDTRKWVLEGLLRLTQCRCVPITQSRASIVQCVASQEQGPPPA